MTFRTLMIAAIAMSALSACGSNASFVRREPTGGRIALQGAFMPAMGEARMLMAEHCGGRFDTLELQDSVEFRCRKPHAARATDAIARAEHGRL